MAQVITTILLDGNPKGLRLIEMANWSGKAFVVPRGKLKEFKARDEAEFPGLYFLFGEGKEKSVAYIGQSENVVGRLSSHDSDREGDEWNSALVFVGNLDSTSVKYLESTSVEMARRADRYDLLNAASPRLNKVSEAQKITADEYFDRIRLITGLFGYSLFDETPKKSDADVYYLEDVHNKDASASGTLLDSNEFVVYAGSKARTAVRPGLVTHAPNVIALRERLQKEGILVPKGDISLVFTKDYIFTSPSIAATTVSARASNGWGAWKDVNGKTLDENVRR